MLNLDWIDEVLRELENFSEMNGLPRVQRMVFETRMVAKSEIDDLELSALTFDKLGVLDSKLP